MSNSSEKKTVDSFQNHWRFGLGGLFAVGFVVCLVGLLFQESKTTFASASVAMAACLILVMLSPRVGEFKISLSEVSAKLDEIQIDVKDLKIEMRRDRLSRRYESYGDLWSRMYPVAIYTAKKFGPEEVNELSEELSKWYFTKTGGFLLTKDSRDFYFALQHLLRTIGNLRDWICEHRPDDAKAKLMVILTKLGVDDPGTFLKDSEDPKKVPADKWVPICKQLEEEATTKMDKSAGGYGETLFCIAQQVSSVLRSRLSYDLKSREDVEDTTL